MRIKKTVIGLAILIGLAGVSGCQRIEPKAAAQAAVAQSTPAATIEQSTKERHYCAGVTKQGVRCRKPVKNEGDYCWMHKDQDKRKK